MIMSNDDAIRATNDDAASCKRFAVQQGYWKDSFIQYFVRASERKAPEINRGYYARVCGLRELLNQFLRQTKGNCQIINVGAGFDTLYWRLKEEQIPFKNFIELDFHGVTNHKSQIIRSKKPLLSTLESEDGDISFNNFDLHSPNYHLIGVDLRHLQEIEKKLKSCQLNKTLPTVFIAECVLVYIENNHSHNLLEWIAKNFSEALFLNYEQVNMCDRFSQVMIENLKKRCCILSGIEACQNLETQKQRFLKAGWDGANAWDMVSVYAHIPQADVQRIEKLEFLDERELMQQLFQHYGISWAYVDKSNLGLASISFS